MKPSYLFFILTSIVLLQAQPAIQVSPSEIHFNTYTFSDTIYNQTLTISNVGTDSLTGSIQVNAYHEFYDFENFSDSEAWSDSNIELLNNDNSILGPFGNESVYYTINDLPIHDTLYIEFDLYVFDTWDYEYFRLFVDDVEVLSTSLYQGCTSGIYVPEYCANLNDQHSDDGVFHFIVLTPHNLSDAEIEFRGYPNESVNNESWGIDNIILSTIGDSSWLSIDSTTFNLESNENTDITIIANISGLSTSSKYIGSIKIASNDSLSPIIHVPSSLNLYSESGIDDLVVMPGGDAWSFNEVELNWTAPAGDTTGTADATAYQIRYGITPDWYTMIEVDSPPVPQSPGTNESFFIADLDPGQVYYFAVRAENSLGELGSYNIAIGTPDPNGSANALLSINNFDWESTEHIQIGDSLYLQVVNADNPSIDDLFVQISSDTENQAEHIILSETNLGSGVYRGVVAIEDNNSSMMDSIIQVQSGDWINITYTDPNNDWGNEEDYIISIPYGGTMINQDYVQGVWDLAGSPYLINNHIELNSDTLTIEAGVEVIFLDNYHFYIKNSSNLFILGTASQPVIITAESNYQEIWAQSNNSTLDINYAHFSNGSPTCLRVGSAIANIRNSKFENCNDGLHLEDNAQVEVDSCVFKNNLSHGIILGSDSNANDGITNTLTNSFFIGNVNSLFVSGNHSVISNCIISDDHNYGIYIAGNYANVDISNCLITDNRYGIISLNGDYSSFSRSISMSTIYNNENEAIKNHTPYTFSAQSNYWGEAVTQIIGENPENNPQDLDIFEDYFDNESYGLINYSNWLEAPSPTLPGQPSTINSLQLFSDALYENEAPGWVSEEDTLYIQITSDPTYIYAKTITGVNLKTSTSDLTGINIALMETDSSSGVWRGQAIIGSETNEPFNIISGSEGEELMISWLVNSEEYITFEIEGPTLPPNNLTASNGLSDYIRLDWTAPSESAYRNENVNIIENENGSAYAELIQNDRERELIGYNVYRAIDEEGPYTLLSENITDLFYEDEMTDPGNFYFYYITSIFIDPNTESDPSQVVSGMRGSISGVQDQAWDDGSAEVGGWWAPDEGYAVRFTSGEPFAQITGAKVYIVNFFGNPTSPFEIRVYGSDQGLLQQGIYASASAGNQWVEVDLMPYNIIANGPDFYIGVFFPDNEDGLNPGLGMDVSGTFYDRSWEFSWWTGYNQMTESGQNYMIRATYTNSATPHSLHAQSDRNNEVYLSWLRPDEPKIPDSDFSPRNHHERIMMSGQNRNRDLQFYNLYRSEVPSGPYTLIEESIGVDYYAGNHYLDSDVINGTTYYYVVTSLYSDGSESPYSNEVFAIPNDLQNPVLYIDDDNSYHWVGGWNFHQYIENALIHSNTAYDFYSTYWGNGPSLDILNEYPVVLWNCANIGNGSLTVYDRENIKNYLDGGGKLFISGMDISNELSDQEIYTDYFSTSFIEEYTSVTDVSGLDSEPISQGLSINFRISGENTPDVIEPTAETAVCIYSYDDNGNANYEYCGGIKKENNMYRLVYLPWDFAQVVSSSEIVADVVYRITDWLIGIEGPKAYFSSDSTYSNDYPFTVNFSDLSNEGDTTIVSWLWNFGDGQTSIEQNPTHTYNDYGAYDVSLTLTDANELIDSLIINNYITIGLPQVSSNTDSLSVNLFPDDQTEETIKIYNHGTIDYDFYAQVNLDEDLSRDISGSTFITNIQDYEPGSTFDMELTIFNNSYDDEWLQGAQLSFPDGVTVNSVSDFIGGAGGPMEYISGSGSGATISWYGVDSDGWGVVWMQGTATATVNISVSSFFQGDLNLNWLLEGDQYGSEPHELNGTIVIEQQPSWFSISPISGSIEPGDSLEMNILFNAIELEMGAVKNGSIYLINNFVENYNIDINMNTVNIGNPVVDFSASSNFGYVPLQINFTDLTQVGGYPLMSWYWDFGDGNTSSERNPSHIYTNMGEYTVTLIVEDSNGNSITEVKEEFIIAVMQGYPEVDFSAEPLIGDAPLSVEFNNGTIVHQVLNDDPSTYQSVKNKLIKFNNHKSSKINSQVNQKLLSGNKGGSKSYNHQQIDDSERNTRTLHEISYHNNNSWAGFYSNTNSGYGVVFDLNNFYLPTLESIDFRHYSWGDFDSDMIYNIHIIDWENETTIQVIENLDASNSNDWGVWENNIDIGGIQVNTSKVGIFIQPLSVNSNTGLAYPSIQLDNGPIDNPGTNFIIDDIYNPFSNPYDLYYDSGWAYNFMIDLWIDDGIVYSWDFGDGSISNDINPNHIYQMPGTYTVELTVETPTETATQIKGEYIQVNPVSPQVDFSAINNEGESPLMVVFVDGTILGTYSIESWFWDFGDGETSTDQFPSHTYYEIGSYTVSLTITTIEGEFTEIKEDFVQVFNAAPADFNLLLPEDNAIISTLTPEFSWENSSDIDIDDSIYYEISIGRNDVIDYSSEVDSNYFYLAFPLIDNTEYQWFVNAIDTYGLITNSDQFIFYTDEFAESPLEFELVFPEINANNLPTTINFQWEAAQDNDPLEIIHYNLLIGFNNELSEIAYEELNIEENQVSLTLLDNMPYYWQVSAVDLDSLYQISETQNFIVNEFAEAPNPFNLIAPISESQLDSSNVQFIWESTDDNDPNDSINYLLSIGGTNMDTTNVLVFSDTTYNMQLEMNQSYYWQVLAYDTDSLITIAGDGEYQSFIVGVLNLTNAALPEKLMLFPAYPNPLNPVTTIKFGLPQASYVNLEIYDINGRIVTNLINHYLHSGYHEINWNAGNHSSGLYFTRLQSGQKVIIQKLIVLK